MMGSIATFLQNLNLYSLASLAISVLSALFCITWHEVSHGLAALALGDPTAKNQGRLTLNPIKHLDPLGLLMMIVAKVGWAKPVPINARYFKHPKRDIAITALAGPVSNFVLAYLAMLGASAVYHFWLVRTGGIVSQYVLIFLVEIAVLSTGLGIFNLIPVSPLDGSKVLYALLPDKVYYTILRYERWGMILMVAIVLLGVLDSPLSWLIYHFLQLLCRGSGFPWQLLLYLM
ncbi:MAG: site-2 protease family protein [Oscillospiraceae bacterium]|nr:site-2 protease family protein [Oscillospiraceae bacterium]